MSKGLRISLITMGLFFIVLGIFLNFQLYISLAGEQFFYKYSYGAIGIGLDISKVICLILGAFLLRQAMGSLMIAGIVSLVFWLVLSLISWAAGWGFTLFVTQKYESEAFQKNMQVQAVQAGIEDARLKVEQLSQYANSTGTMEAKSKWDDLQNQLDALWAAPARNSLGQRTGQTVQSKLGGTCPGTTWYHRQYCPKIQAIESKMAEYKTLVDKHSAYLAAVEHKNSMIKELGEMDLSTITPESYMHPLFIGMGALLTTSPQLVKYRLLLITSAMIELLGSLFFFVGLLLKGQSYSIEDIKAMEKQKHQLLEDLGIKVIEGEYVKVGVGELKQPTKDFQS
jgi:hypothetical protein